MKKLLPLLILIFALSAFAQTDLPIIGKVSDLDGKTKVYISAERTDSRKLIQKALEKDKSFEIVADAEQADFILEFKQVTKQVNRSMYGIGKNEDTGEMTAYFFNPEKRKVVAWSQTKDFLQKGWGVGKKNEIYLTGEFLKTVKNELK